MVAYLEVTPAFRRRMKALSHLAFGVLCAPSSVQDNLRIRNYARCSSLKSVECRDEPAERIERKSVVFHLIADNNLPLRYSHSRVRTLKKPFRCAEQLDDDARNAKSISALAASEMPSGNI